MKELINKVRECILFILWLVFSYRPIAGYATADPPVVAGLDVIVRQDGREIGWATNMSFDEDFEINAIRTLGYHGDRGYKSMGYNCRVTVGTFVLQAGLDNHLSIPSRRTILTSGLLDFEAIDKMTGQTLYILRECKCGTAGTNFDSGSLATKTTTWRCREVLAGEGTSIV